jgi:hypothetical protein
MSQFVARLKDQEKLQSVREAISTSSNAYRQFAAACYLKRAAIVVQKHRMSRSLKKSLKKNFSGLKMADRSGFPADHESGIGCALVAALASVAYWNCTETIFETPASCMVTPYNVSAASMVRLLCVISTNWVPALMDLIISA